MFDLNSRLQFAAIFIFIIIAVDFIRRDKLPLLSVKYFSLFIIFSGINLVFDLLTVYSLANFDVMNPFVNRLLHQIFIGSLDMSVLAFFLYVDALCHNERRIKLKSFTILKLLPAIIALGFVFFGDLKYVTGDKIYSYGLMAYTVYASIAIYLTMSVIEIIICRKELTKNNMITLLLSMGIWVVMAIIQAIDHSLLLSGIGLTGMIVIVYFSFENPKEHQDEDIGCFNHRAFLQIVNEKINSRKEYKVSSIVIEDFYNINSTYGYQKGNEMLATIIAYLKSIGFKYIFHNHGNMISVVAEEEIPLSVEDFLNRNIRIIKNKIEVVRKKTVNVNINVNTLQVSKIVTDEIPVIAHIDIIDGKSLDDTSINNLLSIIDFMGEKVYGGETDTKRIRFNVKMLEEQERIQKVLDVVNKAIKDNGFEMYYQPIYDIEERCFNSAEALVRIKDHSIGFISPEEFIPIAEKYGLISIIGDMIFRLICDYINKNDLKKLGIKYIEINLSAIQCVDTELPARLDYILQEYKVDSRFINLEITETAFITSGEKMLANMRELREKGCSFSMDDFGTGYSNLSKIVDINYDIVKLDKSLIWPCFGSKRSEKAISILDNITNMLYDLKQDVVAEGVETEEQYCYLKKHHVRHIQGYYFSKPLNEIAYLEFISKNNVKEE